MANVFQKVHTLLKRSNKKRMIKASGSVEGSTMEKIRSGQSYLYQTSGMESEVVEIRFRQKISGSFLNQALLKTIERYPYLNTKLVELDGDFYIVKNEHSLTTRHTKKLPRLGHISCGYHLIDVCYYKHTVFASFHHALCDGKGIKPFLETLIYYYCQLKYKSKASSEGIRLTNSPLLPGEAEDPSNHSYSIDEAEPACYVSRKGYALPENVIEDHETDYRYELTIPAKDYIRVCKENGATPVILTSLFLSAGIATLYPDFENPIIANIAVDIRQALDMDNTYKNCVRSMPLHYSREFLSLPLSEQAARQRSSLNIQRSRNNCRRAINTSLAMYEKLDRLPSYEAKQTMMEFFNGMLLNSYVISYLGQMVLNENTKFIESIGFYNSGAAGLGVTMIACGDAFCLNFKQSFASDKYVKAFCLQLENQKIPYSLSEVIPFVTPKDSIIKRG